MKTKIKTGKVSLIVFITVMAVCVAGVAIWCYAVGYQVKEHRQGGSVTWVEYNGSTYYRMDGLAGEYCNFITDHRVSYKPRPVLSRRRGAGRFLHYFFFCCLFFLQNPVSQKR